MKKEARNDGERRQLLNHVENGTAGNIGGNIGGKSGGESAGVPGRKSYWGDHDAIFFGIRMATCLVSSSLFVLAQSPSDGHRFPEGLWVLITVLFVCWFPTLDAASVIEKSIQRLSGTVVGAILGMTCGFLSLPIEQHYGSRAQSLWLVSCIGAVVFFVCSLAVHVRLRPAARVIDQYNYAVILCLLTFSICIMPFYAIQRRQWEKSLYRVTNVMIGCVLGVLLSILVFPTPTADILQDKLNQQIRLAGEASQSVLHTAVEVFSEKTHVPLALADEILHHADHHNDHPNDNHSNHSTDNHDSNHDQLRQQQQTRWSQSRRSLVMRLPSIRRPWKRTHAPLGHDVVLEKYEEATKQWRLAKSRLAMLRYDPFNIGRPNALLQKFRTETANTLARAMRIQSTVVLMDGIVRNDPKHKFSPNQLELLANVGTLIQTMLSVPLDQNKSDAAALKLTVELASVRRMIVDLSATVSNSPTVQIPSIIPKHYNLQNNIKGSRVDLVGMYGSMSRNSSFITEETSSSSQELEDDGGGSSYPKHVQGSHVCSLLFLQLAEHLALRSIRLYQSWRQCEGVYQSAESLRSNSL